MFVFVYLYENATKQAKITLVFPLYLLFFWVIGPIGEITPLKGTETGANRVRVCTFFYLGYHL